MDFDQNFAGNGDWNFPSPHATPTNPTFNHVLQTPKTATFPSHFQDAFSTPQMPGYATPQQPQYTTMTPVQRPQKSSQAVHPSYYQGMQANGMVPLASTGYPAQVVYQGQGYGLQLSPDQATMPVAQVPSPHHVQMQMHTPPPTRGTSAKKPQQPIQVAFGTPSTITSRRYMTPQQHVPVQQLAPAPQTPMHYPQLQFSPDMYQFANLGPASAPAMPQTQLLWEQVRSPVAMPQQRPLEDPFAPAMQTSPAWPAAPPHPGQAQAMSFDTPAMSSFPVQAPRPRPASAASMSTGFVTSMVPTVTTASLDPSLIYSSPVRPIVRSSSRTSKSKLEKPKSARKDSANDSKSPTDSVSPTEILPAVSGPGLRRSNTTGTARPGTAQSAISMPQPLSRSSSIANVPRTASPLKRMGRMPLGSISERKPRKRASVILTIDGNGMARTETRPVEESPTRSIRERYPGLFDSDSSDDESDTSSQAPSRSGSFTFAKNEERRSKAARLDPPVEGLEGLSIPRSGSSASMRGVTPSRAAIVAAAQLRRQGSVRRTSRTTPARRNMMSSSTGSLIDSCPMDMSSEPQQADGGAETMLDGGSWGQQSQQRLVNPSLDAHNRRWSMMSFEQQHMLPPQRASQLQVATRLIRCICGVTQEEGSPLIQCSSCTQWLHTVCVGLEGRSPPPNYTCFLCTKPAGSGFC